MALIFSSVIADVILAAAVIFVVLYLYFAYVYNHWKKRGIHYIKPSLLVGNLGSVLLRKESLVGLFRRLYREAADHKIIGIYVFVKPILVVRDLDVIRCVLAKDANAFLNRFFLPPENFDHLFAKSIFAAKGKKWRHLRIKLTPTFTSGKMKKMLHLVEETSSRLIRTIGLEVSEGRPVEVKDAMSRYAMDTIASCAFGVNANALDDPNCEFIATMRKPFEPTGFQVMFGSLVIFVPWLQYFFSSKIFDNGSNDFIRKTFHDVVDYRRMKGTVRKDFVDLLMQLHGDGEVRAEDAKELEEIKQDSKFVNMENLKTGDSDIKLDDDDIVAQAFIFIGAGFETSSSVLRFALFELAMNPAIQDELRREIEDVVEKHNHEVSYEAIAEMSYLDMVLAETMRKYPPLSFLERECLMDCKLEGTDVTVEKGTVIFIPVLGIHYDAGIYPDPEKFDPERFNTENKRNRSPFAYIPFGEGPRKCIGMRFAFLQMKVALVYVMKTFQVRPCKDTPQPPLEMKTFSELLSPKNEIILAFTKLK